MKYKCTACGYIYDWVCPLCGLGKEFFEKIEE